MSFPHQPVQQGPPAPQPRHGTPALWWTLSAVCWVAAVVFMFGLHIRFVGYLLISASAISVRYAVASRAQPHPQTQLGTLGGYPPPQQYSGPAVPPPPPYAGPAGYPPPQQYSGPAGYPPPQQYSGPAGYPPRHSPGPAGYPPPQRYSAPGGYPPPQQHYPPPYQRPTGR